MPPSQTLESRRDARLRILGIHLAGAGTHKSALVRGSLFLKACFSGLPAGPEHDLLAGAIAAKLPLLPIDSGERPQGTPPASSPLFWEAYTSELGPSSTKDADMRLIEAIEDLGGADVFTIDAPLTLPPCAVCTLLCPGTLNCEVPAVERIRRDWDSKRKAEKRARMPQPYIDRPFEVFARSAYEHPGLSGGFEFEAALGSNRAPLTLRAMRLRRELLMRFPKCIVLETNGGVSALGWGLNTGYKIGSLLDLKNAHTGRMMRAGLLKRLEQRKQAARSATLHAALFEEFANQVEIFLAAMGAMSAWGLFNGEAHLTREFLTQEAGSPLLGWSCVPKDIAHHGWGQ